MKNKLSKTEEEFVIVQKAICKQYGALYFPAPFDKMIGVAIESFKEKNVMPINGLRHPIESETSANWYIWAGDYSEADDFFKPMHIYHLLEFCPQALLYLGLPPGWRFLFDDNQYEDVWYDEQLLNI
ncbi:hypothetical protein L3C95_16000 [Chitinophaga filiformis]|uniref:immunity protein Imm33 domain-containing protein n=1 Tax=Chitinophaga filiformis TaxID=104663 RepID=UPI001F301611|nr:hypothetical protein [Chitinophaga filiformis]MCF6404401.1 hypothetical protein [Chitinophaga filiformis]